MTFYCSLKLLRIIQIYLQFSSTPTFLSCLALCKHPSNNVYKELDKKTYIHPRCANLARLWIWRWTSCIHMSALRPSVDRKTLVIHRWEFVVARLWLRGCPIFWLWPTFIMVHWPASHVRGLKIYIEWSFYMDNRHWENGKGTKRYHKSFRRWFVWGNTIDTESVLPPHLDNELFGNVLPGGARMRMTL